MSIKSSTVGHVRYKDASFNKSTQIKCSRRGKGKKKVLNNNSLKRRVDKMSYKRPQVTHDLNETLPNLLKT